jgi:hypothetical protein
MIFIFVAHLNEDIMSTKAIKPGSIFIVLVILMGAVFRFLPHWPNFTPIAAMALFGGTYLGKKYLAFIIPFAALLISDLIIGFYPQMWAIYLAFGMTVIMGFYLREKATTIRILGAAFASSLLFFLITNFAVWAGNTFYPQNFSGLITCYVAGLAFFNNGTSGISFFLNEFFGTVIYSGVFFGSYYMAKRWIPAFAGI